ncbi:hypothetical protein EC991_001457 [Linnemannia zychae]|nr:hypothetical protein EC991_001457 [Linnemannia zychae]
MGPFLDLFWRRSCFFGFGSHYTRSRGAFILRLDGRSSSETGVESIVMSADGRIRAPNGDMEGGKYLGSFNNLWGLDVSGSDLLSPTPETAGRIALTIRTNLELQLSAELIAKRIAFFEYPTSTLPGRVGWTADITLTNWCQFDLNGPKMAFGWGGRPFEVTSGGGIIHPPAFCLMSKDNVTGDVSVLLIVEREGAAGLKSGPLMTKYANLL